MDTGPKANSFFANPSAANSGAKALSSIPKTQSTFSLNAIPASQPSSLLTIPEEEEKNPSTRAGPIKVHQSGPREIESLAKTWKSNLDQIIPKTQLLEKTAKESLIAQCEIENKLIGYFNTITRISTLHNSLDQLLNDVIDKQNEVTIEIDKLQYDLIQNKGLEVGKDIESIEEIYGKEEVVNNLKKEIEYKINLFTQTIQDAPDLYTISFENTLQSINYLESNIVLFT
jgi:hypothetical protein